MTRSVFNKNIHDYFGGRKLMFALFLWNNYVHSYITFEKYVPRFYYVDYFSGKILMSLSRNDFRPGLRAEEWKQKFRIKPCWKDVILVVFLSWYRNETARTDFRIFPNRGRGFLIHEDSKSDTAGLQGPEGFDRNVVRSDILMFLNPSGSIGRVCTWHL